MLIYAISNNTNYLFSKQMGASIALTEPEPDLLVNALSGFSRNACMQLREEFPRLDIHPGVQYGNESDLYFDDESLVYAILSEVNGSSIPVWPVIHETSDKQPLKERFVEKMVQLLGLCDAFGIKNVTVHLPLQKEDTSVKLLDAVCTSRFLDALGRHDVSIDLEQNWHGSWFGFAENLIAFFGNLDDTLGREGYPALKRKFAMTFDSGHHFAQYRIAGRDVGRGIEDIFDALGHRIRTLHLHGNDGKSDQHSCFKERFSTSGEDVLFKENQDLILSLLPRLDIPRRAKEGPWNLVIVSEISVPFTKNEYMTHSRLIFENL